MRAVAAVPLEEDGARKFFEDNFRPLRISKLGDSDGFLTGYYEPIIEGSRVPTGEFTAPLYRRPPNLAIAGRRKLGDDFPSKGVKVGRRVGRRKLVPYYDRGQIEDGALDGWHLEICWLRSEVDVLFAQIQGSARIRLEDGTILRVNYDSHNGWPYTAVGRALIERKIFTKDEMSMQRIRDWMTANPDEAKEVRRTNKSYVFFRITALGPQDEAVGGQGVPLVPGRSIAIDRALHAYGTPFFIAADLPIANEKNGMKFRRLMVGQDTGSAIVGPARADIYFGAGAEAGSMAGRIKNPGPVRNVDAARARSGRSGPKCAPAAGPTRPVGAIGCRQHDRSDGRRGAVARAQACDGAGTAARRLRRKPERRRKSGACDEPPAVPERGRTRFVDRGCALHQAASSFAPRRRSFGADAIRQSFHQGYRKTSPQG